MARQIVLFLAYISLAYASMENEIEPHPKPAAATLRSTTLPQYRLLESLPMKPFDYSKLPFQPTPQAIRDHLEAQLRAEHAALSPQQSQYQQLKSLEALKRLKNFRNQPSMQDLQQHWGKVAGNANLADLGRIVSNLSKKMLADRKLVLPSPVVGALPLQKVADLPLPEITKPVEQTVQPPICIQFIEITPKALEILQGREVKEATSPVKPAVTEPIKSVEGVQAISKPIVETKPNVKTETTPHKLPKDYLQS